MISRAFQQTEPATGPWASLVATCARLPCEPHDVASDLEARGNNEPAAGHEFALSIKLVRYTSRPQTRGPASHGWLELFMPLDRRTRLRFGGQVVELGPGDLLVGDGLRRHHVVDFDGLDTRAIVVGFEPCFVYSLGSPSHDYAFLLPFYVNPLHRPRVLCLRDEPEAATALEGLLRTCLHDSGGPVRRAGCKAFLLMLLFELATRFAVSNLDEREVRRHEERSRRLKPVFEHVRDHYADRVSVAEAAALVDMSPPQFMKLFKKVAGVTLVAYLNHVRLAKGSRLLRETSMTVADVASAVGFSDQSYFDKRFKRAYGQTPREFRLDIGSGADRNPPLP